MAILTTLARFMNDLISRFVGGAGVGAAILGLGMTLAKPDHMVTVFGQDLYAALALAALFALAGMLLLPALTRRFFHGPIRGRRRRGAAQIAIAAAVVALGILVIKAAMPAADWANSSGLVVPGAIAVLAALALTWLVSGTGLDPESLHSPLRTSRRQRAAELRSMRRRRTSRQAKV